MTPTQRTVFGAFAVCQLGREGATPALPYTDIHTHTHQNTDNTHPHTQNTHNTHRVYLCGDVTERVRLGPVWPLREHRPERMYACSGLPALWLFVLWLSADEDAMYTWLLFLDAIVTAWTSGICRIGMCCRRNRHL